MKKRVYIDGIFDLFHRGHIESFKKTKNIYGILAVISRLSIYHILCIFYHLYCKKLIFTHNENMSLYFIISIIFIMNAMERSF